MYYLHLTQYAQGPEKSVKMGLDKNKRVKALCYKTLKEDFEYKMKGDSLYTFLQPLKMITDIKWKDK